MYVKEKLEKLGFKEMTPIQHGVFRHIDHQKHLVGLAPTGTGKTHAYLLPILERLDFTKKEVQTVILVPTNELVKQIESMLNEFEEDIIYKAYVGSSDKQRELEWLSKYQPQLVIITPKRLEEYVLKEHALKIHTAKYFVMDEADMMFDFDFLSMIDPILPAMTQAKFMLFSATIDERMEPFIKKYFGLYDFIDTTKEHKLNIEYQLINIKYQDRLNALSQLLDHLNPYLCFIFVSKKEDQPAVYEMLLEKGLSVISLSSVLGVKKRTKIIEDIKDLKYHYVVTSDLAARGLDFKISHVIHYDLPYQLEFFMHRSGRTGRMNDSGIVITFMTVNDHRKIDKLKKRGIGFVPYLLSDENYEKQPQKKRVFSEEEKQAIAKIKKPKKVTPNYKKKNKAKVKKAKQEVRRKAYAQNR